MKRDIDPNSLFQEAANEWDVDDTRAAANRLAWESARGQAKATNGHAKASSAPPMGYTAAEEPAPATTDKRRNAAKLDPGDTARHYLETRKHDDLPLLRYWRGMPWEWESGYYRRRENAEVRASVVRYLDGGFRSLTQSVTNNVLDVLRAHSHLPSDIDQPSWLGDPVNGWRANDVLPTPTQILHLPSVANGLTALAPATPRLFTTSGLGFEYVPDAPPPQRWLAFMDQLWPNDQQSVQLLREWFGLCLTPDTTQQKIMLLLGPKRSGKGTIARVLRELVGPGNVAGPTLASFSQNFGLQALLGRTLAIVSDARLGGKSDQATISERLLSISGEDTLTIDRKHVEPVTAKLSTRLMILSNELPRLADASGAMASRFLVLQMATSFYGREDSALTGKLLEELPGILQWAIEGWLSLRQRGHFIQPDAGRELIEELNELSSPIGAFVSERCLVDPLYQCRAQDLYDAWVEWCQENGRTQPGTTATFGRDLRAAVPGVQSVRPRDGEARFRGYEGIKPCPSF